MKSDKEFNGVIFTNTVDTPEKEASLRPKYAQNKGEAYTLQAILECRDGFFEKNRDHIFGALELLRGNHSAGQ